MKLSSHPFIFVEGKGGVGKSTLAYAIARGLSQNHRTLLVSIEDPLRKPGELSKISSSLFTLNNEAMHAFEEYAALKIGIPGLVRLFLQNRLMQYLARTAPGVRELVLMGKIWHERKNYERIVIDMPATGHGITMFQAIFNWGKLFKGSVLAKDAQSMLDTFSDPEITTHVVVSLPEEMPLVESLELEGHLKRLFPRIEVSFIANRLFPEVSSTEKNTGGGFEKDRPFAKTISEHASNKSQLEEENLELWKEKKFHRIPYFSPIRENGFEKIQNEVAAEIEPLLRENVHEENT